MNTSSHSTGATAPATDPAYPKHGEHAIEIDMAQLRRMSAKELWAMGDALRTLSEVISGINNQPRFGDDSKYNPAGEILEVLNGFVGTYHEATVAVAKDTVPKSADAQEWLAWTILNFDVAMTDDLDDHALLALQLSNALGKRTYAENFDARRAIRERGENV